MRRSVWLVGVACAVGLAWAGVVNAQDKPKKAPEASNAKEGSKDVIPEIDDYSRVLDEAIKDPVLKLPDPPEEPIVLQYKVDAPVRYLVRGKHRQAVKDREDLKTVYNSSSVVSYRPVLEGETLPRDAWMVLEKEKDEQASEGGKKIVLEVEKAYGGFEQPALLKQTERTHQIMRQARISYTLMPNGKVEGVRIHEPTSPLGRSSFEQIRTLAGAVQPVFPTHGVKPGDSWSQEIVYEDAFGQVRANQDSKNTYTFQKYQECRQTLCAYITIRQKMKSASISGSEDARAEGSSAGDGEGWMLFDYQKGEVVKTFWKLTGQSTVKVRQKASAKSDGQEPVAEVTAEVFVDAEISAERLDE